ncbi:nicotinamidase-related amidase [Amycolatopsis jiangsuensis]|uniref:Nicotinamidase-related amidase n=2 Tax=Amycolatopsis jiangsuensis TaxID=1181879 RepID=A0A840IR79_9PSEU|nr:nicotinamidase-related amidase [Amycolatopsis jiangsuensis]
MDVQKATIGQAPDGYLSRAVHALETARAAGLPVIHIAIGLRPGHVDTHPRNKLFGALPPEVFTPDDPGVAIHPDVAPADGEIVVRKNRVSAFAGNDLRQILAAQDITHLVLAGIATSGVVLSTALQAADLDYEVTVLSDACADANPALHETLVNDVFTRRGRTSTIDEWAQTLGS